jgi:hypothetical protein
LEHLGKIPVVQGYQGLDFRGSQGFKKGFIIGDTPGINLPRSVGKDPGPGDRKSIRPDTQGLHQGHILVKPMVLVAGNIAVIPRVHLSGGTAKPIPYTLATAVVPGRALYLKTSCRGAPHKILRKSK